MNGTSDILVFNNAEGEMARFDTSGNFGIGGFTNPSATLHVSKSINNYVARFENSDASNPYTVWIREPASASAGYPLLNITNNAGTNTYLLVDRDWET